jgi:predicted nucleic-acid-binding protein
MLAVDTNVVVRFLANDDPRQSPLTRELFLSQRIWIAKSVLLETDWVLRNSYGMDRVAVHFALTRLLTLPMVMVEDESAINKALLLGEQGLDFADALHLASRPSGARFVTFDRALIRRAKRLGEAAISDLPL